MVAATQNRLAEILQRGQAAVVLKRAIAAEIAAVEVCQRVGIIRRGN